MSKNSRLPTCIEQRLLSRICYPLCSGLLLHHDLQAWKLYKTFLCLRQCFENATFVITPMHKGEVLGPTLPNLLLHNVSKNDVTPNYFFPNNFHNIPKSHVPFAYNMKSNISLWIIILLQFLSMTKKYCLRWVGTQFRLQNSMKFKSNFWKESMLEKLAWNSYREYFKKNCIFSSLFF